jgi:regulator of protease activity HflC (stomatin/prohibitin superfamily)
MSRRSIAFSVAYLLLWLATVVAFSLRFDWPVWVGLLLLCSAVVLLLLGFFFYRGIVVVDEMSAAVVFNRQTHNFAYFIDSRSGIDLDQRPFNHHRHTLLNRFLFNRSPSHHFISPLHEHVKAWISKRPQTAKGVTEQVRTREGIPLTIHWSFGYTIDPILIRPGIEYKLARALPEFSNNMIGGRVIHALRYLIEQLSVHELYQENAIKKLEAALRHEVNQRATNLGFPEIVASDVRVGPIEVPPQVEKAIEAAHERELQTATAVKALRSLHSAISQFGPEDMERLAELERLRILEEHGGSFVYSMSSLLENVQQSSVRHNYQNGE